MIEWRDSAKRKLFESQPGVIAIGTLLHPYLPAEALELLKPFGVTPQDNVMSALSKVHAAIGGLNLEEI